MAELLSMASLYLCLLVVLYFIKNYYTIKRFEKIKKRDFVKQILSIENGQCYYCQSINPKNVSKSGFWTYLNCPTCKKTSQIHIRH